MRRILFIMFAGCLLLSGCSWVQAIRGIPQPATPRPVTGMVSKETISPSEVPKAIEVKPSEKNYIEQRERDIFSLNPPKKPRRAIEGANEVERAALKEAYDDMDVDLDKNRNKVFSF